jgi:hypothetical protein
MFLAGIAAFATANHARAMRNIERRRLEDEERRKRRASLNRIPALNVYDHQVHETMEQIKERLELLDLERQVQSKLGYLP